MFRYIPLFSLIFPFRLLRFLPRRPWSPAAWRRWTTYVHWRMETYGVYYPQGRRNPDAFRSLLKQFPSYYRWLRQMDRLRKSTKLKII
jgi:hypothetical protein